MTSYQVAKFSVPLQLRHSGAGSKLMRAVEQEAIQRGCKFAQVDTFSFQARPFYEKQGYQLKMALENVVDEYHRYYLTKELLS
ncbi:GNAT family N-acetyltransferase [Yersinia canariae]|uniref:GNAT family N-acetyltransferase n=1 Tax=Yersinia canariae TaxID=2607663 RepID=UPI0011A4B1BE